LLARFVTPAIVTKVAITGFAEIRRITEAGKLREGSPQYSRRPRA